MESTQVRGDPQAVHPALRILAFEEGWQDRREGDVEGQGLDVVFTQDAPDLAHRLDDLVVDRSDTCPLGVLVELGARSYGDLLYASGNTTESFDDIAVVVFTQAEIDLERAVASEQ
ncbi:hypothetical protein ACNJ7K_24000 [Rhodococcus aetherivorans]